MSFLMFSIASLVPLTVPFWNDERSFLDTHTVAANIVDVHLATITGLYCQIASFELYFIKAGAQYVDYILDKYNMGLDAKNLSSGVCEQQRRRPACA